MLKINFNFSFFVFVFLILKFVRLFRAILYESIIIVQWTNKSMESNFIIFSICIFAVTSNKIVLPASGHGCLCYRNYQNLAIQFSLCCVNSHWYSCIGTITSLCWFTHGFRTPNTHHLPVGLLSWIIACIRSCIHIMLYVLWDTNRRGSFQWLSHHFNWHKWLSVVLSIYGLTITSKRPIIPLAISPISTLNCRSPCISVILYYLLDSFM